MAISHIKSNIIADFTGTVTVFDSVGSTATANATDLVRPSDWNSAHNHFMTLGGNTVGQSTVSGSNIIFQGGNNITLSQVQGVGVGTIVISGNNQTVDTNKAGVGFTSTSTAGVLIVGTNNTNGLSLGIPNYLTTAQPVGAYLTTGRASNDGIGLNTALTANGVSMTANSSGLSLNFPAFLTTAAQSNHSHNFATTTTNGSNIVVATANSAGATIGVPPFITTAAAGNVVIAGSNGALTNTSFQFGNLNGLSFYTSNGSIVGSYTDAGAGAGISAVRISAGTTNNDVSNFSFADSNGVSFGIAGSVITASAAGGGGGGAATVGGYELFPPFGGNTAFSTLGLGSIYFQKFLAPANISFNQFERRVSGSSASSSISAQAAHSYTYGLYSHGTGASTSIYNLIASSSLFMQASYSSNLSAGYTISQGAASYTVSSAGTVAQSALTGFKHMYFPFASTITQGGEYAIAMVMSSATTGATGPFRMGVLDLSVINNLTVGKFYATTVLATNASFVGDYAQGVYSSSSNGLPSTLAISGLTNAVSQQRMYLQFEA